jgi:hypothetical protein
LRQSARVEQKEISALGEIISSSVTAIVAQCWQNDVAQTQTPDFGSFIKVACQDLGLDVIAVVYNVITGPQDNVHKPSALGLTREQLRSEQPQIFALLRTDVHALIVGHVSEGRIYQHLPPKPPQVHDFVFPASDEQIRAMTDNFDFLRLLITVADVPADELLAAAIREAYKARRNDESFLVAAGQALSQLMRSDYDRLVCVLRKIRPPTR